MSDREPDNSYQRFNTAAPDDTRLTSAEDVRIIRSMLPHIPPYLLPLHDWRVEIEPLIARYKIPRRLIELFEELRDFEIAIVIDDSGSMKTTLPNSRRTRWDVIQSMVNILVEFGRIFVRRGVGLYFLNRIPVLGVEDLQTVDQLFRRDPTGYTPLVPVLRHIFGLPPTRVGHDKKQKVIVLTDGAPTDENNQENTSQLQDVLQNVRQSARTFVSFFLCNEDKTYIDILRGYIPLMENLSVTDQYEDELQWIRQNHGPHCQLSYGAFIAKVILGSLFQNTQFHQQ